LFEAHIQVQEVRHRACFGGKRDQYATFCDLARQTNINSKVLIYNITYVY